MKNIRIAGTALLLCVLPALTGRRIQPVLAQAQGREVLLSIGVEMGDTALELSGVTSAVRLSNGDIVLANGGTSQIRWFDARGRFIRALGRRGQGPNEFGRSMFLYEAGRDTIVAHDGSNRRFHYISPAGQFFRTDTLGDRRRSTWIYDRTIVERTPRTPGFGQLRSTLLAIPFGEGEIARVAMPSASGEVWVRDRARPSEWIAFSSSGRPVARIALPERFEPYQLLDSLVLGRLLDSLDVERVQLRRYSRLPAPAIAAQPPRQLYDADAERSVNAAVLSAMQAGYRNLVTAQEAFFADNMRYASTPQELRGAVPEGMKLELVQSGQNSYWMVLSRPPLRTTCMVLIGNRFTRDVLSCG